MGEKLMTIRNQINLAILSSLGLIGMAVAADQAQVATLVRIDGAVVASQDAKYVPAREGMTLKQGDRLMVLEGGSANLAFADGCQYQLGEMAMLTVQGTSTCAANGGGVYKVDPKTAISDGTKPRTQLAATWSNPVLQNQLWWFGTPNPTPPTQTNVYTFTPLNLPNPIFPSLFPWWNNPMYDWMFLGTTFTIGTWGIVNNINNNTNDTPRPPPSI
jgi:hypothetical protein